MKSFKEHAELDEGALADKIRKAKVLNKRNYKLAASELQKRMKKDPSKTRQSHAHDVAQYVKNIDAKKLAAEEVSPPKNNFVAKHAKKYNKAAVHKDRKKDSKRGAIKHKKRFYEGIEYNSEMGIMDWGTAAGTRYMKSNTPGESTQPNACPECGCRCGQIPCTSCGTSISKMKESAAETRPEYKDMNMDIAPEAGIIPLTDTDVRELENQADHFSWQTALDMDLYDEDELESDWDSTVPDDEVQITEVLSVQGRLKRRFAARKNKQKLRVARNISLRRGSTPDRLKKRATRGARGLVYKRLLRGRNKSTMPPAEKARLERMLQLYAPLVSRLSVRLLPNMRKMEISRMKNRRAKPAAKSKKYKPARPVGKKQTSKKFKVKK